MIIKIIMAHECKRGTVWEGISGKVGERKSYLGNEEDQSMLIML
jgi:hypothetical protein